MWDVSLLSVLSVSKKTAKPLCIGVLSVCQSLNRFSTVDLKKCYSLYSSYRDYRDYSYYHLELYSLLTIDFAKLGGRAALALTEDAVEVAEVVEAAAEADLLDAVDGIYQFAGGIAQTDVDDVLREALTGMLVEEAGERGGGHANEVGKGGQAYLIHVVLADILLDFEHTTAVAFDDDLGIGRAGKGAGIGTL